MKTLIIFTLAMAAVAFSFPESAVQQNDLPNIPDRPEVVPEDEEGTIATTSIPVETSTKRKPRPPRPTTPVPGSLPHVPDPIISGNCTQEGIFQVGICSAGFFHCIRNSNGFSSLTLYCPTGTVFNPEIPNCDHPSNVKECSKIVLRTFDAYSRTGQGITTGL
ncbi:unnamed protein product [Orchesella dallaii]|uniref:Chitin-binding type-2 domain-containing protein n=1 Tax=Orchesella dallaii TaxID=48710 RepID=A0ABP1RMC8_9HEXA